MSKFNIRFVPHVVSVALSQQLSHGRGHRVGFCHVNNRGRMSIVLPEDIGLKVRYLENGIMYATQVFRPRPKAKTAPAYKAPQASFRPAASRTLGGMLSNLTAIEQANRLKAHMAQHSN